MAKGVFALHLFFYVFVGLVWRYSPEYLQSIIFYSMFVISTVFNNYLESKCSLLRKEAESR